jgi:hypothetical protein
MESAVPLVLRPKDSGLGVDAESLTGAPPLRERGLRRAQAVHSLSAAPVRAAKSCAATVAQKKSRPVVIRAAFAVRRPRTFGDRRFTVGFAPLKQASSPPNAMHRRFGESRGNAAWFSKSDCMPQVD